MSYVAHEELGPFVGPLDEHQAEMARDFVLCLECGGLCWWVYEGVWSAKLGAVIPVGGYRCACGARR